MRSNASLTRCTVQVLRSREFEGYERLVDTQPKSDAADLDLPSVRRRQYLVQFMANSSLKRMSTTSVLVPLEGVLRSVPALSVARLVIPVLPRILLPPPASTTSAPPPLSSRDLVRVRMLLLAQDAVRSASPPPGADAALPPHDLFGLSPRVWAKEVPHYLPKETYAALAERLNAAARREGLNALAEELARREGRPEHLAGLVVQWSITLRLLAALFAVRRLFLSSSSLRAVLSLTRTGPSSRAGTLGSGPSLSPSRLAQHSSPD